MDKKLETKKVKKSIAKASINGFALGFAAVILGETAGIAIANKSIEGGFSSILEGKAMETTDFEKALEEYKTVQAAYNYYLSGEVSTYHIGDFDYSMMGREYYNAETAGKKTYLKNCLDKKIIEYCKENPKAESIDIQKIYEDMLWEIINADPTFEYDESKNLEDYVKEYYGIPQGLMYTNYKNLELNEEEQKTVQFIKKQK